MDIVDDFTPFDTFFECHYHSDVLLEQRLHVCSGEYDRIPTFHDLKTDVNKVNEVIDEGYTSPFAFTITIKPFMFKCKPKIQLSKTLPIIQERLKNHIVSLVWEFTKNYNVHYHGIIQLSKFKLKGKDPMYYWYNIFRRDLALGFTNITQITHFDKWVQYLMKSSDSLNMQNSMPCSVLMDNHNLRTLHLTLLPYESKPPELTYANYKFDSKCIK